MQSGTCQCHRLAISLSKVLADDHLEAYFRRAIQAVSSEEINKVIKFRYKDDALASLLGRLFLRQMVRRMTSVEWNEIEFGRTEKGKPFISSPPNVTFGVNVTHQGDYVALASSCSSEIGVDCMRLEKLRNNKTADEYINSMERSSSPEELRQMRGQPTEQMKMAYFYRYWCLKEAVLKATGEGLLSDLRRLDFAINPSDKYRQGCFVTSTTMKRDGILQDQWIFEETFIDSTHAAAVCRLKNAPKNCMFSIDPERRLFFGKVDLDFLLEGSSVITPLSFDGTDEWIEFVNKPRKNF
ncbi:hypothetical protein AB6A40_004930 [Gnathostoma spinigerum]|uniref:L-aminoadipate-semialdehyde dehydrogenase-phosphopantetheinyl transferase n=1 Tax=Gnathostoma spinigerum TaxID=75299 RepID=A0ABD6ELC6_9BILA